MTILVTGSAGHLGEALVRRWRAVGRSVMGLDIKPSPFTDHVGSITDRAFLTRHMQGVRYVLHAATLHKPHVATHSQQDFIDTNIAGTLALLEVAKAAGVKGFIFTSTTSAFGAALTPAAGEPAAWVTEDVTPIPRNIYGVSKVAAESLCELHARSQGMPVIILRTSRFFPEMDDDAEMRSRYSLENAQAVELLYRRVDIADVVSAHECALARVGEIGFGRYIISAPPPFVPGDAAELRRDMPAILHRYHPDAVGLFAVRGWSLFPGIDRVYDSSLAVRELGWQPRYSFAHVLDSLRRGVDFRSDLALAVGSKGYHDRVFCEGPYPV